MSAPLLGHGTYPGGKLLLHEALEHPRQRPVTATHHNAARLARIRDRVRQKLVQELHAMRQSSFPIKGWDLAATYSAIAYSITKKAPILSW